MNREPNVHAEPAEIDPVVIARAEAVTGPLVMLPIRYVNGQAVYTESSMLVVKRLRATGLDAAFLDPPESRTFEVKESALTDAIVSFALGIGSSAAWDAVKAVFRRQSSGSTGKLSITYVDLDNNDGQRGTAWKVEGDSEAVLKAIDKLRQNALEASISGTAMEAAGNRDITDSFPAAGTDDDLRKAHRRQQVESLRAAAQSRLQDARDSVEREGAAQPWQHAEKSARAALALFARSLDWAEDSEDEDEAHRLMDKAGSWVWQTFGCQLARSGIEYRQTCPVALAHNRIGMSIGGTAKRLCSLCGDDLSECEHIPGTSYLVPGGVILPRMVPRLPPGSLRAHTRPKPPGIRRGDHQRDGSRRGELRAQAGSAGSANHGNDHPGTGTHRSPRRHVRPWRRGLVRQMPS